MAINANSFVTAFKMANSMKNNRQGISSVKLNQIQLNNKKQVIIMSLYYGNRFLGFLRCRLNCCYCSSPGKETMITPGEE